MLNKSLKYSFFLMFVAFFVQCSTTDYDFGREPKIVINSFLSTARSVEVILAQSYNHMSEEGPVPITNAKVTLYENGQEIAVLYHDKFGRYLSPFIPRANNEYEIVAEAPGFPTASGKVEIPPDVQVKNFRKSTLSFDRFDTVYMGTTIRVDTIYKLDFSFTYTDFPAKGNVYRIQSRQAIKFGEKGNESEFSVILHNYYPSLNPGEVRFMLNPSSYYSPVFFISDSLYNGQDIEVETNISLETNQYQSLGKYYLYFECLSQKTYDYYVMLNDYYEKSRYLTNDEDGMSLDYLSSESIINYIPYVEEERISNGFGFIGAASGIVDTVIIQKPDSL